MSRNEFISRLTKKLRENKISDAEEIISQYEEHFTYKLADGYSEEEIAAKLGNPEALAIQYVTRDEDNRPGVFKAIVVAGLVLSDIFAGLFFILLYAWAAVMAAFSIASATTGICMIAGYNPYLLIPEMPYWCAAIFSAAFIALSVLTAVGCIYFALYVRWLLRVYGRYCHNQLASASGKAILPPLVSYPKLSARLNRKLRMTARISLTVFAVCFVSGYIVCSFSAGALEFWHEWNWFK